MTHRFTGQELDPETGLYYYGGRYYDQEISRFISPDPYVQEPDDPQNLNRYTYVLNSPMNYTDPSGFFWWLIPPAIEAITAAAGAAVEAVGTAISSAVGNITGATAVKAAAVEVAAAEGLQAAANTAYASAVANEAGRGTLIGLMGARIDATVAWQGAMSKLLSAQSAYLANLTNAGVLGVGMATEGVAVGITQAAGKGSLGPLPKSPTGDLIRQMHGGGSGGAGGGKGVKPYDVGKFSDLKGNSAPGDKLDIHHARPKALDEAGNSWLRSKDRTVDCATGKCTRRNSKTIRILFWVSASTSGS